MTDRHTLIPWTCEFGNRVRCRLRTSFGGTRPERVYRLRFRLRNSLSRQAQPSVHEPAGRGTPRTADGAVPAGSLRMRKVPPPGIEPGTFGLRVRCSAS